MKQITTTVEQFLSAIVGVGLICFFSFILLLASAQLNDSTLGDLLARLAGETARTARTESFAYWGKFGQEVASGLGVLPGSGTTIRPTPTAAVVVATQPPSTDPQPTATPFNQPTATPLPPGIEYIRESPLSKAGVLLWQGLDPSSLQSLPAGVDLEAVKSQVTSALAQHPGDLTALWLQKRLDQCGPAYQGMLQAVVAGTKDLVYSEADRLIGCNPRAVVAYAAKRWADIKALPTAQPVDSAFPIIWPSDETQAVRLLDGLSIGIGGKMEGTARGLQPTDPIAVTVLDTNSFGLGPINIVLTVSALDTIFGMGNWTLDDKSKSYFVGTNSLFPNPASLPAPNPAAPSEADLVPPTTPPASNTPSGAAGGAEITTYTVQSGDTVSNIARRFGITNDALITANPDILGPSNPNYIIYPGQVLNIPAP